MPPIQAAVYVHERKKNNRWSYWFCAIHFAVGLFQTNRMHCCVCVLFIRLYIHCFFFSVLRVCVQILRLLLPIPYGFLQPEIM